MLRALLEHGVEPDLVVGTSAGALNSAFFARQPTLARVERLKQLWLEAPARQIFPVRPRALVLGISGRRDYLVPNEGLRRWIVDCLDFTLIEETAIPLHIVATNLLVGTPVVLSDGPVTPALMASTAIPGVFAPVTIGGDLLIDGGVAADTFPSPKPPTSAPPTSGCSRRPGSAPTALPKGRWPCCSAPWPP